MFVQSRAIEVSLFPYAVLLQVTPVVAIAPLIIILVKNTQLSLTICANIGGAVSDHFPTPRWACEAWTRVSPIIFA